MTRQIYHKVGMRLHDLNLGRPCLDHILSKCSREGYTETRWHPKVADAYPEEVNKLCNKLRRGVGKMTQVKCHRGGRYESSNIE